VGPLACGRDAAQHGAQAHRPSPAGRHRRRAAGADWLVLDDTHPSMVGRKRRRTAPRPFAVRGRKRGPSAMSWVAGRWVILEGRHAADEALRGRFAPPDARACRSRMIK